MTTRNITLSIALLTVLASHYAMAMDKDIFDTYQGYSASLKTWLYRYPNVKDAFYQANPKLYELDCKQVLMVNLINMEQNGVTASILKNYEESLLDVFRKEKQKVIIKNLIRMRFYPHLKSIEWKK